MVKQPSPLIIIPFRHRPGHCSMLEDRGAASCVQFDQALAAFPWLASIACALFGSVYDPSKLRFTDRLIASLPASPQHNMPATPRTAVWGRQIQGGHL